MIPDWIVRLFVVPTFGDQQKTRTTRLDLRKRWAVAIVALVVLLAGCDVSEEVDRTIPATPSVYHVSPQGDDDADGQTGETAFRTIARALEAVRPGDTVLISPGTYGETLQLGDMGHPDVPITIRGASGTVVLDGGRKHALGLWCDDCANVVVESLEIRNYTDVGIGFHRSTDITLRNLVVHDNGSAVQLKSWELEGYGIDVDNCQKVTIEDNEVYQNGPQPRPFGTLGTGINTYECTDCVIRNNHSYENIGGGILVEDGINVIVEGNTVTANYLDATEDEWWDGGIWIDGGHDITVTNNVFQDNLGPGVQISDEDHQQPFGYVLEGNVIRGNYYGIYIWNFGTSGLPPKDRLCMSDNQISGNAELDIWIVPWECPPPDPCG